MKIKIKTFDGNCFAVELEPSDTILSLKQKIAPKFAPTPLETFLFVHNGFPLDKDTELIRNLKVV